MLLCDFHVHSSWSDGKLAIPDVVDLFGRSHHDVIAITDHVVNTDTVVGKAAHKMGLSLTRERFGAYLAEIESEARRAWDEYRMIVLPGVELTRNAATGNKSAHALALGIRGFVSADGPMEDALTRAREAGAITVACHPNEQSGWFENTLYLWKRRNEVSRLLDLWEVACRWDLFPQVAKAPFNIIGNSDFHRPAHLYAWKTLADCEKSPVAVLRTLRRGSDLGLTRLYPPPVSTPEREVSGFNACPCLPALSNA